MPHIVHVSSVHKQSDVRIFQKQCRSLRRAGFQVSLVVPGTKGGYSDGVNIVPFKPVSSRVQRIFLNSRLAIRTALALDGDLYHLHDPELLIYASILKKRGKPYIFDMHENLPEAVRDKYWLPKPLRYSVSCAVRAYERYILPSTPTVFAEASYSSTYPWIKRSCIVQNFPDLSSFLELRRRRSPSSRVGYIGGISPERGSVNSLLALSLLRKEGFAIGFDCVGSCTQKHLAELTALCEREGLRDVRFYGPRSPHEAYATILNSFVGLAVLQPKGNYLGSYPTKFFEYLCLGIPAVISNFPLYESLIGRTKGGLCVDPLSPNAIADAIRHLFTHQAEASQMAANGYDYVRAEMNWETQFPKLLEFYRQVTLDSARPVSAQASRALA